ncbi:hypothetical protein H312_03225 [Anncaliia algerae PRA339]|uniref:60S ribosomal protein L29 n=1 Tax=Anncaliia algerae PRA339 TaxID=1288291 RepID=A0A059EXC8_9MICR|nr:hypothetical protein H312_03225 [Anncaliia algerae PRA339]
MAKKKNRSNHNQNRKDHRNGIKRIKIDPKDTEGISKKVLKNMSYARKYNGIGRVAFEEKYGPQD